MACEDDGDLMVAVGDVTFTSGRESIGEYNESLAGARVPGTNKDRGPRDIDAIGPDGRLLKYVQNVSTLPAPGEADEALMAFQHRLCVAGKGNMVPWPKPENYDPADFLLMQVNELRIASGRVLNRKTHAAAAAVAVAAPAL